jgi:preprotein translocase subunit SecD
MQSYKNVLITSLGIVLLTGCALFGERGPEATLRIHEQVSAGLPESRVLTTAIPRANLKVPVNPYPALSEKDVQSAGICQTAGVSAVMLRFDSHGTFALDELTTRNRGAYLVTFLNGRPVAAWLVDRRITNGQFLVEGDFSDEDAKKAVESLNRMSKKRQ